MNPTQLERTASLEVQVDVLQSVLNKHIVDSESRHKEMNRKLDDLLTLKHKGLGAFWLASALVGTGIIGAIGSFFDWWKGLLHG